MALIPKNRYPAQTDDTDPDYPHGKARNGGAPGDGNGTPFERDLVNDIWGFLQALLEESGVTPSGSPDTASNSQYLQALAAVFVRRDTQPNVQVFTASGTWTKPSWAREVTIICVGGGGGGSGGGGGFGAGGGSGIGVEATVHAGQLDATATVTVGTGGAGGASATGGDPGTASSFVSGNYSLTAAGGSGGTTVGGDGWSGGGGTSTSANSGDGGTAGASGQLPSGGTNPGTGFGAQIHRRVGALGGAGGALVLSFRPGGGGGGGYILDAAGTVKGTDGEPGTGANFSGPGLGGSGYGGGGGGGSAGSSTNGAGGAGAPGVVIVISR